MRNIEGRPGVVTTFGRFNPPTRSHEAMFKFMEHRASKLKFDVIGFASKTEKPVDRNPLEFDDKMRCLEQFSPIPFLRDWEGSSIPDTMFHLQDMGYTYVEFVCGPDRVSGYDWIKRLDQTEDALISMKFRVAPFEPGFPLPWRASQQRDHVRNDRYSEFLNGAPRGLTIRGCQEIYKLLRKKIGEEAYKEDTPGDGS